MTLLDANVGEEYIVKDIQTDDEELNAEGIGRIADINVGADDFTIFSLADTHVKTAEHYSRFSGETMADLASTVNAGNYSSNSFAVILGDIMFDNYEQVENVKASLVDSPVPVFPCFGNHDCSSSVGETELDLISKYQQHFGPVDYSFNIGLCE